VNPPRRSLDRIDAERVMREAGFSEFRCRGRGRMLIALRDGRVDYYFASVCHAVEWVLNERRGRRWRRDS
jgi:hypothetical protein